MHRIHGQKLRKHIRTLHERQYNYTFPCIDRIPDLIMTLEMIYFHGNAVGTRYNIYSNTLCIDNPLCDEKVCQSKITLLFVFFQRPLFLLKASCFKLLKT